MLALNCAAESVISPFKIHLVSYIEILRNLMTRKEGTEKKTSILEARECRPNKLMTETR